MSSATLPDLKGLGFDVLRSPIWSNRKPVSVSGKETAVALWSYPRWKWELTYNFLRGDSTNLEFQSLAGFFNQRQGGFDTFLYSDPDDNSVTGQQIGVGDGTTKTFQMIRTFGGFIEPVLAPNVISAVYKNGVSTGAYTVDNSTGLLTFTTAPANGVILTADFSFYFRCRFVDDTIDFNKFMSQMWGAKKVAFISVK